MVKLCDFWCGGGAGCYDLGFIITQIIYELGEEKFILMVNKINNEKAYQLEFLIRVGLSYGDNNKDKQMDNKSIEIEFPKLYKRLKIKQE